MAKSLVWINSQDGLSEALDIKNALIIPSVIFIVGLIIAFLGYYCYWDLLFDNCGSFNYLFIAIKYIL